MEIPSRLHCAPRNSWQNTHVYALQTRSHAPNAKCQRVRACTRRIAGWHLCQESTTEVRRQDEVSSAMFVVLSAATDVCCYRRLHNVHVTNANDRRLDSISRLHSYVYVLVSKACFHHPVAVAIFAVAVLTLLDPISTDIRQRQIF